MVRATALAGLAPPAVGVLDTLAGDGFAGWGAVVVDDAAAGSGVAGLAADAGAGVAFDDFVEVDDVVEDDDVVEVNDVVEVELLGCGAATGGAG